MLSSHIVSSLSVSLKHPNLLADKLCPILTRRSLSMKCEFLFAPLLQRRLSLPPLFRSSCVWLPPAPCPGFVSRSEPCCFAHVFLFPSPLALHSSSTGLLLSFCCWNCCQSLPSFLFSCRCPEVLLSDFRHNHYSIWSFISHRRPNGTLSPRFPLFPSSVLTVLSNLSWSAFFLGFPNTVILVLF